MGNPSKRKRREKAIKKLARLQRQQAGAPKLNPAAFRIVSNYVNPDDLVQLGPMVAAEWSVPSALANANLALGRGVPAPARGIVLVDTGATKTSIDLEVAKQLGLKQIGFEYTYGAGGLHQLPVFEAHCAVSMEDGVGNTTVVQSDLMVAGIPDLQTSAAKRGLSRNGSPCPLVGLLGRDFLRHTTMTYDGPKGRVEIRLEPKSLGSVVAAIPGLGPPSTSPQHPAHLAPPNQPPAVVVPVPTPPDPAAGAAPASDLGSSPNSAPAATGSDNSSA